jgi:hypothetical protein
VLRLLLDEHIAPAVAVAMRLAEPGVHVESLAEWQEGRYIGLPDDVIIAAANRDGRTLVTYDQVTIVPLLVTLAERGDHHGGVVFVSHWTIRQKDVGTLARTLVALWSAQRRRKWADRCVYARP